MGGGGAGGSGNSVTGYNGKPGAMGGYVYHPAFDLDDSDLIPVTIGAGGTGRGGAGKPGGNSQFGPVSGPYIKATGGEGGPYGDSTYNAVSGSGVVEPSSNLAIIAGVNGAGATISSDIRAGSPVTYPGAYGGGGGGGFYYTSSSGDAGGSGIVIVRWPYVAP